MIFHILNKLKYNLIWDIDFIGNKSLSFIDKLSYLLRKYYSILINKRKIIFLSNEFNYDKRLSPALLPTYIKEIDDLSSNLQIDNLKTVLDIGSNIGQWAFTLKSKYPHLHVYSFEPIKEVYQILKKNTLPFKNWKSFNYALDLKEGKRNIYSTALTSTEASFFKENLKNRPNEKIKENEIKTILLDKKTLSKLNIPKNIDLVKIDVEGAEKEVVSSLKGIEINFLYIEVSLTRRGLDLNGLQDLLLHKLGKSSKIIFFKKRGSDSPCMDCLLKLENAK
jgi:FkbM family methyltransferase